MDTVTSADGTVIAYDRLGEGEPVIVAGGATCSRAVTRGIAEELAKHVPVLNYDRRGRGDSGDTRPYAVEREIEDLAALIDASGGAASLYGHSSGAALALRAAAHGLPLTRLVLHEAPYGPDSADHRHAAREYGENLRALLANDRRGDAIALFCSLTGMPDALLDQLRRSPAWPAMAALAPSLAYDSEVMGDLTTGGMLPAELAAKVAVPTLVISGGASPDWMIATGQHLADTIPDARHEVIPGHAHVVPEDVLAPILATFITT
jgi:pimeloyl-ACP methyl ester carboxylesterase